MVYAESDTSPKILGTIDLREIDAIRPSEVAYPKKVHSGPNLAFEVVLPTRTYYLVGSDEATTKYWTDGLGKFVAAEEDMYNAVENLEAKKNEIKLLVERLEKEGAVRKTLEEQLKEKTDALDEMTVVADQLNKENQEWHDKMKQFELDSSRKDSSDAEAMLDRVAVAEMREKEAKESAKSIKSELKMAAAQVSGLEMERSTLSADLKLVREELRAAEGQCSKHASEVSRLNAILSEKDTQVASLTSAMEESRAQAHHWEEKYEDKLKAYELLQKHSLEGKATEVKELSLRLGNAEAAAALLEQSLKDKTTELASLHEKKDASEKALMEDIAAEKKKAEEMQIRATAAERSLEEARASERLAQEHVDEHKSKAAASQDELSKANAELTQLREKLEKLRSVQARQEERLKAHMDMEAKRGEEQRHVVQEKSKVEAALLEAEKGRVVAEERVSRLEETLSEAEESAAKLKEERDELASVCARSEESLKELGQSLAVEEERRAGVEREARQLTMRLSEAESRAEEHSKALGTSQERLIRIQEELEDAQDRAVAEQLEKEGTQAELETLRGEMVEALQATRTAEEALAAERARAQAAEESLKGWQTRMEHVDGERKSGADALEKAHEENRKAIERVQKEKEEALEKAHEENRKAIERVQKERESALSKLESSNASLNSLKDEMIASKERLKEEATSSWESEKRSLLAMQTESNDTIAHLKRTIDALEEEKEKLKVESHDLHQHHAALVQRAEQAASREKELQESIQERQEQLEHAQRARDKAKASASEARERVSRLESLLDDEKKKHGAVVSSPSAQGVDEPPSDGDGESLESIISSSSPPSMVETPKKASASAATGSAGAGDGREVPSSPLDKLRSEWEGELRSLQASVESGARDIKAAAAAYDTAVGHGRSSEGAVDLKMVSRETLERQVARYKASAERERASRLDMQEVHDQLENDLLEARLELETERRNVQMLRVEKESLETTVAELAADMEEETSSMTALASHFAEEVGATGYPHSPVRAAAASPARKGAFSPSQGTTRQAQAEAEAAAAKAFHQEALMVKDAAIEKLEADLANVHRKYEGEIIMLRVDCQRAQAEVGRLREASLDRETLQRRLRAMEEELRMKEGELESAHQREAAHAEQSEVRSRQLATLSQQLEQQAEQMAVKEAALQRASMHVHDQEDAAAEGGAAPSSTTESAARRSSSGSAGKGGGGEASPSTPRRASGGAGGDARSRLAKAAEQLAAEKAQNQLLSAELERCEKHFTAKLNARSTTIENLREELGGIREAYKQLRQKALLLEDGEDDAEAARAAELENVKRELFHSLAMSMKLHMSMEGRAVNENINNLYTRVLEEGLPYAHWSNWIHLRLQESAAQAERSREGRRGRGTFSGFWRRT